MPPATSESYEATSDPLRRRYRTRDRARWVDGNLFLDGRMDWVVKIRGHRVDLAGLEALLYECPAVSDGVMLSYKDSVWAIVISGDLEALRAPELSRPHIARQPPRSRSACVSRVACAPSRFRLEASARVVQRFAD